MGFNLRSKRAHRDVGEYIVPQRAPADLSDRELLASIHDLDMRFRVAVSNGDADLGEQYNAIRRSLLEEAYRRGELRSARKLSTGAKIAIAIGALGTTALGIVVGRATARTSVPPPANLRPAGKDPAK